MDPIVAYRAPELDRTTWPEFRDRVAAFTVEDEAAAPRSYPGYPRWPLKRCRPRLWPALERTLWTRRSVQVLSIDLPIRSEMSRLLQFSHGVCASHGRGPTPSAGGLQALELYLVVVSPGWLPTGVYHYDRTEHALAQVAASAERQRWLEITPSMQLIAGGALLWVVVGDGFRVGEKYGERGGRFLLLEAGHLMQNLCLMSERLGWTTVPLGGFFEGEIVRALTLPADDVVLYVGILGQSRTLHKR